MRGEKREKGHPSLIECSGTFSSLNAFAFLMIVSFGFVVVVVSILVLVSGFFAPSYPRVESFS